MKRPRVIVVFVVFLLLFKPSSAETYAAYVAGQVAEGLAYEAFGNYIEAIKFLTTFGNHECSDCVDNCNYCSGEFVFGISFDCTCQQCGQGYALDSNHNCEACGGGQQQSSQLPCAEWSRTGCTCLACEQFDYLPHIALVNNVCKECYINNCNTYNVDCSCQSCLVGRACQVVDPTTCKCLVCPFGDYLTTSTEFEGYGNQYGIVYTTVHYDDCKSCTNQIGQFAYSLCTSFQLNTCNCLSCVDGYKIVNAQCVSCGVPQCIAYHPGCFCTKCAPGYTADPTTGTCVICNTELCIGYSDQCTCNQCINGYKAIGLAGCTTCVIPQCTFYSSGCSCSECTAAYIPDGQGACTAICQNAHCLSYSVYNNCTCGQCFPGFGLDVYNNCQACNQTGCAVYSSQCTCSQCSNGFAFVNSTCQPCNTAGLLNFGGACVGTLSVSSFNSSSYPAYSLNGGFQLSSGLLKNPTNSLGSFYFKSVISITQDFSFFFQVSTTCSLSSSLSSCNSGFAFNLQANSSSLLGGSSTALGILNEAPIYSLAFEPFNQLFFWYICNSSSPLITVQSAPWTMPLQSGSYNSPAYTSVWIDYTAASSTMNIFTTFSTTTSTTKPLTPVMSSSNYTISSVLSSSVAFVGFSAASGGLATTINSLIYCSSSQSYINIVNQKCTACAAGCTSCPSSPSVCNSCGAGYLLLLPTLTSQTGSCFNSTSCPFQYVPTTLGSIHACTPCPYGCQTCLDQTRCTSCLPNFQLFGTYCSISSFNFPSQSNLAISLNGNAQSQGNSILLTQSTSNQVGSAYIRNPVVVTNSFSIYFQAVLTCSFNLNSGKCGSGFSFNLQPWNASMLGSNGVVFGILDQPSFYSITFETISSQLISWIVKPQNSAINIISSESLNSPSSTTDTINVWIDYSGSSMFVYVSLSSTQKPPTPIMTSNAYPISSILSSPTAYIGFSASTGSVYESHLLTSFIYCGDGATIAPNQSCIACNSTCSSCSGSSTTCTGCAANYVLVVAYYGDLVGTCVQGGTCPSPYVSTGTLVGVQSTLVCSPCPSGCASCINPTSCLSCAAGYTFVAAVCTIDSVNSILSPPQSTLDGTAFLSTTTSVTLNQLFNNQLGSYYLTNQIYLGRTFSLFFQLSLQCSHPFSTIANFGCGQGFSLNFQNSGSSLLVANSPFGLASQGPIFSVLFQSYPVSQIIIIGSNDPTGETYLLDTVVPFQFANGACNVWLDFNDRTNITSMYFALGTSAKPSSPSIEVASTTISNVLSSSVAYIGFSSSTTSTTATQFQIIAFQYCSNGQVTNSDLTFCDSCTFGCSSCVGDAGSCTVCNPGFVLLIQDTADRTGTCEAADSCPAPYYQSSPANSSSIICDDCAAGCLQCTGPTQCLICETGLNLNLGICFLPSFFTFFNDSETPTLNLLSNAQLTPNGVELNTASQQGGTAFFTVPIQILNSFAIFARFTIVTSPNSNLFSSPQTSYVALNIQPISSTLIDSGSFFALYSTFSFVLESGSNQIQMYAASKLVELESLGLVSGISNYTLNLWVDYNSQTGFLNVYFSNSTAAYPTKPSQPVFGSDQYQLSTTLSSVSSYLGVSSYKTHQQSDFLNLLVYCTNGTLVGPNLDCVPCAEGCSSCVDFPDACTSCETGYYLLQDEYSTALGQCVQGSTCPAPYQPSLLTTNTSLLCSPCIYGCLECSTVNQCDVCEPGFTLNEYGSCLVFDFRTPISSDFPQYTLYGNAILDSNIIQLLQPFPHQTSGVYIDAPINVLESFSVFFQLSLAIASMNVPFDAGFAFNFLSILPRDIGSGGTNFGILDQTLVYSIVFDTTTSQIHVYAINKNASLTTISTAPFAFGFTQLDAVVNVWIDYDTFTGNLQVFQSIDPSSIPSRPTIPSIVTPIYPIIFAIRSPIGYIGFSASSVLRSTEIDLWNWIVCGDGETLDLSSNNCVYCSYQCGSCSGNATTCTSCYNSSYIMLLESSNQASGPCIVANSCPLPYVPAGNVDGSLNCSPCPSECTSCVSATNCTSCIVNYSLVGTTCTINTFSITSTNSSSLPPLSLNFASTSSEFVTLTSLSSVYVSSPINVAQSFSAFFQVTLSYLGAGVDGFAFNIQPISPTLVGSINSSFGVLDQKPLYSLALSRKNAQLTLYYNNLNGRQKILAQSNLGYINYASFWNVWIEYAMESNLLFVFLTQTTNKNAVNLMTPIFVVNSTLSADIASELAYLGFSHAYSVSNNEELVISQLTYCGGSQTVNVNLTSCSACSTNCNSCVTNPTSCTSCNSGNVLLLSRPGQFIGTCSPGLSCPIGYYFTSTVGSTVLCAPCLSGCLQCSSLSTCISCVPGLSNISGFCTSNSFQLPSNGPFSNFFFNGAASVVSNQIQLNPNQANQAGSVYAPNPINVAQSFSIYFQVVINCGSSFSYSPYVFGIYACADGFAFNFQPISPYLLGGAGSILGILDQQPIFSFGVETFSSQQLTWYIRNTSSSLQTVQQTGLGLSGHNATLNVWIDYFSFANLTQVYYLNSNAVQPSKPISPAFSSSLYPISSVLGSSTAYIGFSSGTGGSSESHVVSNWLFCANFQTVNGTLSCSACAPNCSSCSGSSTACTSCASGFLLVASAFGSQSGSCVLLNACPSGYLQATSLLSAICTPSTFKLSSTSSLSGLAFNGVTSVVSNQIQLNPNQAGQVGSVYLQYQLNVLQSFSTYFQVVINCGSSFSGSTNIFGGTYFPCADGFAFNFQPISPYLLGGAGGTLGILDQKPIFSFGVETFSSQQLTWYIRNTSSSLQTVQQTGLGLSGNNATLNVWIDYFSFANLTQVYYLNSNAIQPSKPLSPVFSSSLYPISSVLGSSTAYIGFSSGTGGSSESHVISNWLFCANSQTIVNSTLSCSVCAQNCTSCSGTSTACTSCASGYTLVVTYGGQTGSCVLTNACAAGYSQTINQLLTPTCFPNSLTWPTNGNFLGFFFNGAASVVSNQIQLNPNQGNQAGSVYAPNPINVAQSFSTYFQVVINCGSSFSGTNYYSYTTYSCADGFAFNFQSTSPYLLGAAGSKLGILDQQPIFSFGVETFSSQKLTWYVRYPSSTLQTIQQTGLGLSGSTATLNVWIDYFSFVNLTQVYYLNSNAVQPSKPLSPVFSSSLYPISSVLGSSTAYIGFSSGTGGSSESHVVSNWFFCGNSQTVNSNLSCSACAQNCTSCSGSSTACTSCASGYVLVLSALNAQVGSCVLANTCSNGYFLTFTAISSTACSPSAFQLPSSTGFAAMSFNGAASVVSNQIQLNPNQGGQAGSAYISNSLNIAQSFSTYFQVVINCGSSFSGTYNFPSNIYSCADGFAFNFQPISASLLGGNGGTLGILDQQPIFSFGVETYSSQQLTWYVRYPSSTLQTVQQTGLGLSGSNATLNVWIDYNSFTNLTQVYYLNSNAAQPSKPISPVFSSTLYSISSVLGSSVAYVGFSSGTGGSSESHVLTNWAYCLPGQYLTLNNSCAICSTSCATCFGSSTACTSCAPTYTLVLSALGGQTGSCIPSPSCPTGYTQTFNPQLGLICSPNFFSSPFSGNIFPPFTLNGAATLTSTLIALTPNSANQVGSFYINPTINIGQSFSIYFQVNVTCNSNIGTYLCADGFAFNFQTVNASLLGQGTTALGIFDQQPFVSFAFETYSIQTFSWYTRIPFTVRATVGQISLSLASVKTTNVNVWIDYDLPSDLLQVYYTTTTSTVASKPASPTFSATGHSVASILASSTAYMGFSSSTTTAFESHTVNNLVFCGTGKIANSTSNSCTACPTGCYTCLSSGVCTSCSSNYTLLASVYGQTTGSCVLATSCPQYYVQTGFIASTTTTVCSPNSFTLIPNSNSPPFTYSGSASIVSNTVQLNPNSLNQAGSFYINTPISITQSLSVFLQVTITCSSTLSSGSCAYGFSLNLQNYNASVVGAVGSSLGSLSLSTVFSVAIQIYNSPRLFVQYNQNGSVHTPSNISFVAPSSASAYMSVWFDYNYPASSINVYGIFNSIVKPSSPTISLSNYNISSILGNQTAFIGISGATGGSSESHQVSAFVMCGNGQLANSTTQSCSACGSGCASCTSVGVCTSCLSNYVLLTSVFGQSAGSCSLGVQCPQFYIQTGLINFTSTIICSPDSFTLVPNSNSPPFTYSGSASIVSNTVQLNPNSLNQAGSFYINTPISITQSLSVFLQVTITCSNTLSSGSCAYGFALNLQNYNASIVGAVGSSLGSLSLSTVFSVAIQIYNSPRLFVQYNQNGSVHTPSNISFVAPSSASAYMSVWFDYNYPNGSVNVYGIFNSIAKPSSPTISLSNYNISSILGNQTAFIGISGATGGSSETHQVSAFVMCGNGQLANSTTQSCSACGSGCASCTSVGICTSCLSNYVLLASVFGQSAGSCALGVQCPQFYIQTGLINFTSTIICSPDSFTLVPNSNSPPFTYSGSASIVSNTIQLNPNSGNQAGSFYINTPITITQSLSVFLQVTITCSKTLSSGLCADGFALNLQNYNASIVGAVGSSLGSLSLSTVFSVAMEIYSSPRLYVQYNQNGTAHTPSSVSFATPSSTSASISVWFDYNYPNGSVNVYGIFNSIAKPSSPTISLSNYNISSILGYQTAFIGISGATGGLSETHQVSTFVMCGNGQLANSTSQTCTACGNGCSACSNQNVCASCINNYLLSSNGSCILSNVTPTTTPSPTTPTFTTPTFTPTPTPTSTPTSTPTILGSFSTPISLSFPSYTLNGNSQLVNGQLQLTNQANNQQSSVYLNSVVDITQSFSLFYQVEIVCTSYAGCADGFSFNLQATSATVLDANNNGGSVGILDQSIPFFAVAVETYNVNLLRVYTNTANSNGPSIVASSSIPTISYFASTLFISVWIDYNLNYNVPWSIYTSSAQAFSSLPTKPSTPLSFTSPPSILPSILNSNQAFIGFSAGTGGLSQSQTIVSWIFCTGNTVVNSTTGTCVIPPPINQGGFPVTPTPVSIANLSSLCNTTLLQTKPSAAIACYKTIISSLNNGFIDFTQVAEAQSLILQIVTDVLSLPINATYETAALSLVTAAVQNPTVTASIISTFGAFLNQNAALLAEYVDVNDLTGAFDAIFHYAASQANTRKRDSDALLTESDLQQLETSLMLSLTQYAQALACNSQISTTKSTFGIQIGASDSAQYLTLVSSLTSDAIATDGQFPSTLPCGSYIYIDQVYNPIPSTGQAFGVVSGVQTFEFYNASGYVIDLGSSILDVLIQVDDGTDATSTTVQCINSDPTLMVWTNTGCTKSGQTTISQLVCSCSVFGFYAAGIAQVVIYTSDSLSGPNNVTEPVSLTKSCYGLNSMNGRTFYGYYVQLVSEKACCASVGLVSGPETCSVLQCGTAGLVEKQDFAFGDPVDTSAGSNCFYTCFYSAVASTSLPSVQFFIGSLADSGSFQIPSTFTIPTVRDSFASIDNVVLAAYYIDMTSSGLNKHKRAVTGAYGCVNSGTVDETGQNCLVLSCLVNTPVNEAKGFFYQNLNAGSPCFTKCVSLN